MKNIIKYICISILVGVFTGCDDYLDNVKIVNVEDASSGFITEAQADQAMAACYAPIKSRDGLNGRSAHVLFDISTQDLKMHETQNAVNSYSFSTSSGDVSFTNFWKAMYETIGRCNNSFTLIEGTEAPDDKKSRYNSEAKVLRSIMYYNLMMAYGEVPLVLEPIAPTDKEALTQGAASRDEIYTAMITDLEEAIANQDLPWEKDMSSAELGHVGKATAYTALAYVYLTRGWEKNSNEDFTKAKNAAKKVIDEGGYTLEPVILEAFYKSFNSESIWALVANNTDRGFGTYVAPWFVQKYTTNPLKALYKGGWDCKMEVTERLYNALEDGDARRYLLANGSGNYDNDRWAVDFLGGDNYDGGVDVTLDRTDFAFGEPVFQCSKPVSPIAFNVNNRAHQSDGIAMNWNIYRLADVYLLYAEACIKSGDDDEAVIYINKVRERSRNAWSAYTITREPTHPGIPADVDASGNSVGKDYGSLLDALKNERRIELNAEMKRMIDIRRWSLGGASDLRDEVEACTKGTWDARHVWFPIPQEQKDLSEGNLTDAY